MFKGGLELSLFHVLENESSTSFSLASITENLLPSILRIQHICLNTHDSLCYYQIYDDIMNPYIYNLFFFFYRYEYGERLTPKVLKGLQVNSRQCQNTCKDEDFNIICELNNNLV